MYTPGAVANAPNGNSQGKTSLTENVILVHLSGTILSHSMQHEMQSFLGFVLLFILRCSSAYLKFLLVIKVDLIC